MAVRILDLQLIYGVSGARDHFERLCAHLIRSKFPDGKGVRVHKGDGGVDTYVGNWADSGGIHVFQVKFFPTGLGEDQKKQVRESFKTCLANQHFVTTKWTLCLPVDLSQDEISWFNKWKQDKATETLTSDNIEWWGEKELEGLLFKSENRGIKEAFFQEEHLTQIREMHGMLLKLIDDVFNRNLDDDSSAKIRSHITKLLKYPKAVADNVYADHSGFVEYRYTEGMYRELFYFLNQHEDEEIKEVPVIGAYLTKYKEDYYQFKTSGNELYDSAIRVISDNVAVRFVQGWRIYFDYFLARLTGLSQKDTVRVVQFNYDITPQEAERIYVLLSTHVQLLPLINKVALHRNAIAEDISKLKELI